MMPSAALSHYVYNPNPQIQIYLIRILRLQSQDRAGLKSAGLSSHTSSFSSFKKKIPEFLGSFNKKVYLRSRFADTPASVRQDAYCIPPVAIVRQAYGGRVYGYI